MTNETEAPEYERTGSLATYNLMDALKRNPLLIQAGADICAEAVSTIKAQAARIAEYEVRLRELEAQNRELALQIISSDGQAMDAYDAQREAEQLAAQLEAVEAKLAQAEDGLRECEQVIDGYIWQEYPFDHPVHERYRQRDFDANPARATLEELKEQTNE